jgi:hypothetical protein
MVVGIGWPVTGVGSRIDRIARTRIEARIPGRIHLSDIAIT